MATARQRAARIAIVAQAALVWSQASGEQIAEFIRCGDLQLSSDRNDVMPYDQAAMKALVATGRLG